MATSTRVSERPAADLTPGQIERELVRLSKQESLVTRMLIDRGRGDERPSETRTKTDELSNLANSLMDRRAELNQEMERRWGPGTRTPYVRRSKTIGTRKRSNPGNGKGPVLRVGDFVHYHPAPGVTHDALITGKAARKGPGWFVIAYKIDGERADQIHVTLAGAGQLEFQLRASDRRRNPNGPARLCAWCYRLVKDKGTRASDPVTTPGAMQALRAAGVTDTICTVCDTQERARLARYAARKQSNPSARAELVKAARLSETFHGFQPRKLRHAAIKWPKALAHLGACVSLDYMSDKHTGQWVRYFHEFTGRCDVYAAPRCMPDGDSLLVIKGNFKVLEQGLTG